MNVSYSMLSQITTCQSYAIFYQSLQSSHYFLSPLAGVEVQAVTHTLRVHLVCPVPHNSARSDSSSDRFAWLNFLKMPLDLLLHSKDKRGLQL